MKRLPRLSVLVLVLLGAGSVVAQEKPEGGAPADLYGTWSGSWEGGGSSGGFELTLEKPKEKAAGGRVAVTGEPTYNAEFKTLSFDGRKMTAIYDFPPDDQLEVVLNATFDGSSAKGTWTVRQKPGASEVATGTWAVARK
ncbi:MAG TPA: hypothetical protein VFJ02_18715 [Vicinamibacterales bacterium]|nr:hypothetical protein [Vicinamibacterales bacterium]